MNVSTVSADHVEKWLGSEKKKKEGFCKACLFF